MKIRGWQKPDRINGNKYIEGWEFESKDLHSYVFVQAPQTNNKGLWWVRVQKETSDMKYTFEKDLFSRTFFKTKAEALYFAINYMRSHPNG